MAWKDDWMMSLPFICHTCVFILLFEKTTRFPIHEFYDKW